jgi:predicted molibdopterin-dependent oxidoreductase YjgC
MVKDISVVVDGRRLRMATGSTLLQAAARTDQRIPTLCSRQIPCLSEPCGICVVELDGEKCLKKACSYAIERGLSFHTYTRSVRRERRRILSALLLERQQRCVACPKLSTCALVAMARTYDLPVPRKTRLSQR